MTEQQKMKINRIKFLREAYFKMMKGKPVDQKAALMAQAFLLQKRQEEAQRGQG